MAVPKEPRPLSSQPAAPVRAGEDAGIKPHKSTGSGAIGEDLLRSRGYSAVVRNKERGSTCQTFPKRLGSVHWFTSQWELSDGRERLSGYKYCVHDACIQKGAVLMHSLASRVAHPCFIITCLFLATLGVLAACGTTKGPGQQPPSCGALSLSPGPQAQYVSSYDGKRVKDVEQCFVQAHQQCKAMALLVTEHGTDTGTNTTYTVAPHGASCQIVASSQAYSANFGGSTGPVITTTCQGLTETTEALVIGPCQGQDVLIPRGEACGGVYSQATPAAVRLTEACFARDYQQCYPALLYYVTGSAPVDTFRVSASCQLTLVQSGNLPGTPCASLTQQADGLHMIGCGSQGDILVPARP